MIVNQILEFFKSIIFPQRCPYCNTLVDKDEIACTKCSADFPHDPIIRGAMGGYICASPFAYAGLYKAVICRFKFREKIQHAYQLSYVMANCVKKSYKDINFDYITYVPLHKSDHKKRGYNQSQLLANQLSLILNIPCEKMLIKTKHTPAQHTRSKMDRLKNVKGAFVFAFCEDISGKKILLVDDIITTGATLGECCKELQKHKPDMIRCITFASSTII